MENPLRLQAREYRRAAEGGLLKPEKFTAEAVFQLVALAIEGCLLAWLEDNGGAPSHHGFHHLVRAVEARRAVPAELKKSLVTLDRYSKLCEWIPLEPRVASRDELPGLLDLARRVEAFTAPQVSSTTSPVLAVP